MERGGWRTGGQEGRRAGGQDGKWYEIRLLRMMVAMAAITMMPTVIATIMIINASVLAWS